ncbi:RIP metalloprotease RseP [Haemophilus parahaemolyticus]|uniref:RIP metalloprotease RseP n=1 Tax=Haemophilus parahaemolyticus TaxID=735 RepID=UPI002491A76C|nr:RIP metalloprotease RseP [Haemophilus parahaemolyticus]
MSSIISFFILICILVFVHEYGHFWAARCCGVKVIRFSIGFGKILFRKKDKHGTEFAFSLIPLGGYVQMWSGEPEINKQKIDVPISQSLSKKSPLQRAFIISAGPIANFILAVIAYWVVFVSGIPTLKPVVGQVLPNSIAAQANVPVEFEIKQVAGKTVLDWEEVSLALIDNLGAERVEVLGSNIDEDHPQRFYLNLTDWKVDATKESPLTSLGIRPKNTVIKPEIAQVLPDSAAEKAGLKAQDKILTVNHQPFDWQNLVKTVQTGQPITLEIEGSNQQKQAVEIMPEKQKDRYVIGITPTYEGIGEKYQTVLEYDMLTAIGKSVDKVGSLIHSIFQFIGNLIKGELSLNNMSGPISMAKGAAATAAIGWVYYLSFMALISVNLGVMNLFPLLPLDGGQLLLLALEAIKRKPVSEKFQLRFQQLGMLFVLSLMAFAFTNDVIHF